MISGMPLIGGASGMSEKGQLGVWLAYQRTASPVSG
jgi:hypothetical protein